MGVCQVEVLGNEGATSVTLLCCLSRNTTNYGKKAPWTHTMGVWLSIYFFR